jgi:drug/metabolite transporter (DMT)-like permease
LNKQFLNLFLFIILSIIWGSSFILMKEGLVALNPFQVASIRIICSGLVLLPWAIKYFRDIPSNKILTIFLAGALGNLIPAYLFCYAELQIDSALAGTLNSLTPIFVIITGVLFFQSKVSSNKVIGIIIAFIGSVLLMLSKGSVSYKTNFTYGLWIVIATLSYGINVNLFHRHLSHISSLKVAAIGLNLSAIPALIVLIYTGYFNLPLAEHAIMMSTMFSAILGVFGTAIATVLFYMLVKSSGTVYSSMVTYGIPVVANIWGIIFKENVGFVQFLCLGFILIGVYITNRAPANRNLKA